MRVRAEKKIALMGRMRGGNGGRLRLFAQIAPLTGWRRFKPPWPQEVTTIGDTHIPNPVLRNSIQCRRPAGNAR